MGSGGCAPSREAVRCLAGILGALGKGFMMELVRRDPQFAAIKGLEERAPRRLVYELVIYNSLVSYRLREAGEEYWDAFAREVDVSADPLDAVISFVLRRRELAYSAKVKRLRAIRGFRLRVEEYLRRPGELYRDLRSVYGFRYSKTAALAVKMFCYAAIAAGECADFPEDVPMPVDSRVMRASIRLGLVEGSCRSPERIADAWGEVARMAGLPALLLDAFIWGVVEGGWGVGSSSPVA